MKALVLAVLALVYAQPGVGASAGHGEIPALTVPQPAKMVPLEVSGHVTGGGQIVVSWPGFQCTLDIFNEPCPHALVPADSTISVDFSPNLAWAGDHEVFYGLYTFTSNMSCRMSVTAVRGRVSCTYATGEGGSIAVYAPRCTTATGWTAC